MTTSKRVGMRWQAFVAAAVLGLAAGAALAQDERPRADDQCVAKCDEASDQCMSEAGQDGGKQRACDKAYDDCLRKCG